jgi:hypothetical protein
MTEIVGFGSISGSISQRHGSADPDPHQNVMDPQHCFRSLQYLNLIYLYICGTVGWCSDGAEPGYSVRVRRLAPPLPARTPQARVALHMEGDMGQKVKNWKIILFSYFYLIKSVSPKFASDVTGRFLDFLLFSNRL